MVSQKRIKKVKASGIALVILGLFIFFTWGLPPLLEANMLDNTINCQTIMKCVEKPVNIVYKNSQGIPTGNIYGTMNFYTNYTFVVDKYFNYDVSLQTTRTDVTEMMFVIDSINQLEPLKNKDPNRLILDATVNKQLVNTTMSNGVFHAHGIFRYGEPTDLAMFVMIANKDKFVEYAGNTQKLITVQPELELDDIKNNFENRKTNKIILGLTWTGVALAPLLLGGDLISRVVMRDD